MPPVKRQNQISQLNLLSPLSGNKFFYSKVEWSSNFLFLRQFRLVSFQRNREPYRELSGQKLCGKRWEELQTAGCRLPTAIRNISVSASRKHCSISNEMVITVTMTRVRNFIRIFSRRMLYNKIIF